MFIMRDYECQACKTTFEALRRNSDIAMPKCNACDTNLHVRKIVSHVTVFNVIVPTGVGTKKLKAGYEHSYRDRPAEKIMVGYGPKYKG